MIHRSCTRETDIAPLTFALLRPTSIMDRIRNRLLNLLRQRLLQGLWHLAVASRVAHFARLLVAAGVVDGLLRSALAG